MNTKKAAVAAVEKLCKNSNNRIVWQVRKLFLSGKRFTALDLNRLVGFNDARKIISDLRKSGMIINDLRLADGRKQYWQVPENEPTLFDFLPS